MEARNELKYILANTNELLKFGEAKHAGLILLNAALIVGIITCYDSIYLSVYKPMILLGIASFGISIFTSIIAQFPITSNKLYFSKAVSNPNIYFYGHLASLDTDKFLTIYKEIDSTFKPSKFHMDLINQILVNARITQSKFAFFKFASFLTALGVIVIGVSTIIKLI